MWRFTGVLADMIQEVLLSCESFRTEITSVRCLSSMPHNVVREVFFPRKRLPTNFTSTKRFQTIYFVCSLLLRRHIWICLSHIRVFFSGKIIEKLLDYLNGVSLVWLLIWFDRCSFLVYFLPHIVQWWGVSPVCHMTWFMKCSLRVNDFLQISHLWGVSPVCFLTWFTMCSFLVNVLAQNWHLKHTRLLKQILSKVFWKILPVRCFTCVTSGVVVQVFFSGKSFSTCGTTIRLVGGMPLHMPL